MVVTGLGATTPLGGSVADTWESLLAGRCGVQALEEEWAAALPVRIAARARVEPREVLGRVEARRLDRSGQFALVAAREAWADAGTPVVEGARLGVAVATGMGGVTTLLAAHDLMRERGPRQVSPLSVPMLMPNGPAVALGVEFGARAGVHAPTSACASGAEAIAQGFEMIRAGRADVVIAGGAEAAVHPLPIAAFGNMMALSRRNDDPARASRPYDRDRDGFVLGEGAGILVLESARHAAARGARHYGRLAGAGLTSDGYHVAEPAPGGGSLAEAVTQALAAGGIDPSQVAHVNAHATATPKGDLAELAALKAAFGPLATGLAICATKSMTGHLLGAAGAVEAIATVLALHHRTVPATVNIEELDQAVDLDIVRDKPRDLPLGPVAALSNSIGFGGHNVVLAFRVD